MSDSQEPAATPALPDIFTPSQQLLTLLCISNRALLSRPNDPLPLALAELTDYDQAAIDKVQNLRDSAGFYALLDEEPETIVAHLLLGRLTYASPLGQSLTRHVVPDDSADAETVAERRAELLAFIDQTTPWNIDIYESFVLARYAEDDRAEVQQYRSESRAAIEGAFAAWEHSLGAMVLPAPDPVLPPDEDETGWSIEPMQIQLDILRLAVTVLTAVPNLSAHPFAAAVRRLPDYHPQRLEELTEYLHTAVADQPLALSRMQGLLLYVACHVIILLLVADLLDGEGLDDMLLRRGPALDHTFNPKDVKRLRRDATIMLTAYIDLLRQHERETADFQALETRLAPVLALAVS